MPLGWEDRHSHVPVLILHLLTLPAPTTRPGEGKGPSLPPPQCAPGSRLPASRPAPGGPPLFEPLGGGRVPPQVPRLLPRPLSCRPGRAASRPPAAPDSRPATAGCPWPGLVTPRPGPPGLRLFERRGAGGGTWVAAPTPPARRPSPRRPYGPGPPPPRPGGGRGGGATRARGGALGGRGRPGSGGGPHPTPRGARRPGRSVES